MEPFAGSFEDSDDTTRFPNGQERLLEVAGTKVGLATFGPGWRWSNDIRPLVGTDSCQVTHVGYVVSGHLHVETNDGATLDIGPGQAFVIPAGHDGWVVGDEPCVMLDWGGKASEYARPVAGAAR
jgi:Cupin domain